MNNARTEMEDFLRAMDRYHRTIPHCGLPALLLESGKWFQGRASSDDYHSARQWRMKNRPKSKECYFNAQSFCLDYDRARYFEGFAVFPGLGLPTEHAWVAMDGKVVDFTFEALERMSKRKGVSCDTRDTLYVGAEVPTAFISDMMRTREWFEALAEEYSGQNAPKL